MYRFRANVVPTRIRTVVPTPDGAELTIWDSKESEFALGLEYRSLLSDAITDLDWAATPDGQSLLAVGFAHRVELLCQQRATYFDQTPGWGVCWKVDVGAMVPHPISDSIWLARGTLLVGAGHQLFMYGQRRGVEAEGDASKRQEESLFEHVARLNGPLDDYHPQMVLQCLLWGRFDHMSQSLRVADFQCREDRAGERYHRQSRAQCRVRT